MKKAKRNLVYKFDDANRVEEAIECLELEHWNDISDLTYMQVPAGDNVFHEMTRREIHMMMHYHRLHPEHNCTSGEHRRKIHVISLRVKRLDKIDEIGKVLWSCGGYESDKNGGWYKGRSKRIYQIILDRAELRRTMKRLTGKDDFSPVKGFGA